MGRWIQDFQQSHTNVRINYQSIGSGGGIQQVKSGTIDFGASDAPTAPDAYPIPTLTFLIIPKGGKDVQKRTALKQFLTYVVTDGQPGAGGLKYAPLPDAVKQLDVKALSQLTVNGSPIQ
jgi:ABC-type phosphate transport system substrate-binding protein